MATIQDVRAIHNPQKSYMWEVEIQGAGASVGTLQELAFYAKSVSMPQTSVEQIIINHKAGKTHHAGRDSSGHSVTVTFWDDENLKVLTYLQGWMDTLNDPTTGNSVARDQYLANMVIKLKDTPDSAVTGRIEMSEVFPIDLSDINLSYDVSDPIEISCTFSFDRKVVTAGA